MATYKDASKIEDAVLRAEKTAEGANRAGAWIEARRLYEKALDLQEDLFAMLDDALELTNKKKESYQEEIFRCRKMQQDIKSFKQAAEDQLA